MCACVFVCETERQGDKIELGWMRATNPKPNLNPNPNPDSKPNPNPNPDAHRNPNSDPNPSPEPDPNPDSNLQPPLAAISTARLRRQEKRAVASVFERVCSVSLRVECWCCGYDEDPGSDSDQSSGSG